ncbi:MAG TPA: NAD-dependent epimerase/dehydratase family protein [Gemmatimonadota bacterium]|nr:NAD-dependent epimerase/dehydratase family protein [Gemmatimonadota bacterium]
MRVLVIGGSRFVGPRLVRSLVERGHAVTTFTRGLTPNRLPGVVERLHGDRTDPSELGRALAGRSFDGCVDTIAMRGSDTTAAIDLLDGRIGHYVHFSTGQVYLVRQGCPTPAREEDYDGPLAAPPTEGAWDVDQWEYGIEKRECEDALEAAWTTRGFPATRLRLTMVHGEDDPQGRIRAYVQRLQEGGPLLVPIEPIPLIRPISASAVVETVVGIVESGKGKGAVYNLAQGEAWSHDRLVTRIAEMLGTRVELVPLPREELLAAGVYPGCAPLSKPWMSVLDSGRAARELGFRPGSFDDWLPAVVERVSELPSPHDFEDLRAREIALA